MKPIAQPLPTHARTGHWLTLLTLTVMALARVGIAQTDPIPVPNMRTMLLRNEKALAQLALTTPQQEQLQLALEPVDAALWRLRDQDVTLRHDQVSRMLRDFDATLTQIFAMKQRGYPRQSQILQRRAYEVLLLQAMAEDATSTTQVPKTLKRACPAPELQGVTSWINSPGLTLAGQRGRVVILHFFTSDCGNCINNFATYNRWFQGYDPNQVAMIGIHRPECDHERPADRVEEKISTYEIAYPVAIDNDSTNWALWANPVWPSIYLIDRAGFVRYWWYGELQYGERQGEAWVQTRVHQLLQELP